MNYEKKFNISICSYNVYWKIMDSDPSLLSKKIDNAELLKLKENLLKNIFLIKNYYDPYFYCFQESSSYNDITNIFEKSKYDYYVNYSKPEFILTIWKKKLFIKKKVFDGDFEPGRPFSIFIFEDARFNINFILINIHAGHNKNTLKSIFEPIQQTITKNINQISKFDIQRIVICGDFNRDIGKQILGDNTNTNTYNIYKYKLTINAIEYKFIPIITNNKTCCNLNGYGYNINCDQVIDSFDKPIMIHPLSKEKWYKSKSSDHVAIL